MSTSYIERLNLTMRMWMRRYYAADQRFLQEGRGPTRHGMWLHSVHYNFCRSHKTTA